MTFSKKVTPSIENPTSVFERETRRLITKLNESVEEVEGNITNITNTVNNIVSVTDGDKGDITVSAGGASWNIDNNVVDNVALSQMPSNTLKGNNTGGVANASDLTVANVKTMLSIVPKRVVGVVFDGSGSTPTVGSIGYVVVPFSGTIDQWYLVSDVSGSAVVDVWKAGVGVIPTNANSIAGTEKPTLSAQQTNSDTGLSTWTTAVTTGEIFAFELESVTTCTRITVSVRIQETV